MVNEFKHIPVLPFEVLDSFRNLERGSLIVDGTLGKGGHSKLLLENGFRVIGVDRDKEAIEAAKENIGNIGNGENFRTYHGNFAELRKILNNLDVKEADGILLDLGVSTYQLEDEKRGFGFVGKLDMRMDQTQELTAEKVVNEYPERKLAGVLYKYGERVNAKSIARRIANYRKDNRIETGGQLLKLIQYSMSEGYRNSRKHHWATPTFRALRIEVNKDFENLEMFLNLFPTCLSKNGILSVITFHSMEEAIVRKKFEALSKNKAFDFIVKGVGATKKEETENPKSKRAKLWAVRRK